MNKKELRDKYRLIRKNIKNKEYLDNIIFKKAITNDNILKSDIILIYVSTDEEIDTLNIINHLLKTKKVAVPKTSSLAQALLFSAPISSINNISLVIISSNTSS